MRAFADLEATEFHGTRKHLRNAAEELTKGNNPGSIRESIHAVESVVRVLEPQGDFAKALAKLDAKVGIHGAMKAGFSATYTATPATRKTFATHCYKSPLRALMKLTLFLCSGPARRSCPM